MDSQQPSWIVPTTKSTTDVQTPSNQPSWIVPTEKSNILDNPTQVTQDFGTYNPIEPTAGHLAGDTNFAANQDDPIRAPKGDWEVVKAYNQASPQGAPGNYADNQGWGNDVWLKDPKTGQVLHFLHMAAVSATPGQKVRGGQIVGTVGSSGNATGSNLGVEYYNAKGELGDVLQSPYATALPTIR